MAWELQVKNTSEPRRRLALTQIQPEDGEWLTICYAECVELCLPQPVRFEGRGDAEWQLRGLYPYLADEDRRVVMARAVLPQRESY